MRHQNHVKFLHRPQVAQDAPKLLTGKGIERAKRLIEQQHFGFMHQRPADAGALLHAARQLPRKLVAIARQAHAFKQLKRARFILFAFGFKVAAEGFHDLKWQQHVVQRGAPRQQ